MAAAFLKDLADSSNSDQRESALNPGARFRGSAAQQLRLRTASSLHRPGSMEPRHDAGLLMVPAVGSTTSAAAMVGSGILLEELLSRRSACGQRHTGVGRLQVRRADGGRSSCSFWSPVKTASGCVWLDRPNGCVPVMLTIDGTSSALTVMAVDPANGGQLVRFPVTAAML